MARCKAILVNKKGKKPLFYRCNNEASLDGYCIMHYKIYVMKKEKKK